MNKNVFNFQLIISADSLQFGNNGRNPQVPNVRPDYPERTPTPQTTVTQNPNNPFLPNTPSSQGPLNCNAYPKHPMCGEVLIETTTFKIPGKALCITLLLPIQFEKRARVEIVISHGSDTRLVPVLGLSHQAKKFFIWY